MSKSILRAQPRLLRALAIAILALLTASASEANACPLPPHPKPAEKKLVEAAKTGEVTDYTHDVDRTIPAKLITALAVCDDQQVAAKGVRIEGAKIVGPLDFEGAKIPHPLYLTHCFIAEPITLRDADALTISFEGSHVAGITADRLHARGGFFLQNGFHATGEVDLSGAKIGGDLDCSGGTFENANATALDAEGAKVDGEVFLNDGFRAKGEVKLLGAKIGGDLTCSAGIFDNTGNDALSADNATVDGNVLLRSHELGKNEAKPPTSPLPPFQAHGAVRLPLARIGGVLDCSGGTFAGKVDLTGAQAGELRDDEKGWPGKGNLLLDGFVYGRFRRSAPWRAGERRRWLELQPDFRSQPYEQLIKVLKEMGHEDDAIDVAIAEQQDMRERGRLTGLSWFRNWLLDKTIKYGYESWRAFLLLLVAWFLGTVMFGSAKRLGLMMPSDKDAYDSHREVLNPLPPGYPSFHAWLYALDLFVPGIDLHQKSKWSLHERHLADHWYWLWKLGSFFYFVACWALTLIGVGAVTGLVRPH